MNIVRIALATAVLLLLPLVAMQFTDGVTWGPADFVVAGVLLFGSGLTYELIAGRRGSVVYRFAVGLAVAAALLLVWVNLAVGIIGDETNPANLMYGGVLVIGFVGAAIAGLKPCGMARALFAMALAQAFVAGIALTIWKPEGGSVELVRVVGANALFVTLFVGSALLFQRAAREEPQGLATGNLQTS